MNNTSKSSRKRTTSGDLVNCEKAGRGVWLVKVPRYLSEMWEKNAGNDVGRLITGTGPAGDEVVFKSKVSASNPVNESNIKTIPSKGSNRFPGIPEPVPLGKKTAANSAIPDEHRFIIRDLNQQAMALLLEDKTDLEEETNLRTGKLSLEGRVVKRAECQPPKSSAYMQMKIQQIEKISQPKNTVKQMDRAVVKFKPTANHAENMLINKAKKDGIKSIRGERSDVLQDIFHAFEKHQYYRLVDLQKVTNQPANFIKEILMDIATYNTAFPHKSMWELKPEYRNYKAEISGNSTSNE